MSTEQNHTPLNREGLRRELKATLKYFDRQEAIEYITQSSMPRVIRDRLVQYIVRMREYFQNIERK